MKILFVTECLGSGGAERQLVGLATLLKKQGYDVSVLTYFERNFFKSQLDQAGIYNECYKKALNRYTRFFYLTRKADSFKADIVVSYLPGANIALTVGKVLGLLKSKLIVSERNFTLNWNIKSRLSYKILSFSDCLVVNSEAEKINVKNNCRFYRNKLIVTIQNFIDSKHFVRDESINRVSNNIVCVARLRDYKNVDGFLDCVGILRDRGHSFTVKWFGHDYNDDYSMHLKKKIADMNLSEVFSFYNPSDNILKEYQHADVLCLPSFREGYPNVVIEAMSCELPVLCSNVCENPIIVQDGVNGFLFNPYDVNDMVRALESYFKLSFEDRYAMGQRNRKKVVENNSMESFVNKYIVLFNQI